MAGYVSKTTFLWTVLCCVLVSVRVAGGHVSPDSQKTHASPQQRHQQQHQQESLDVRGLVGDQLNQDLPSSGRQTRQPKIVAKREAVADKCSEIESPAEPGLHKMRETNLQKYTFFVKPELGFQAMVFQMKIDNLWDAVGPYVTDERIVYDGSEVQRDGASPWMKVHVQYYRHQVRLGRDKHALVVRVGNWSRSVRSTPWWRTHSYEGFVLLVEGPAKLLFNCLPAEAVHHISAADAAQQIPGLQLLHSPVLLGCVLGGALLLVVAALLCLAVARRQDAHPPVPPLPKSLLLQRGQKTKGDSIYEEIDEDTLLRHRQMLDPETFACYNASSGATPPPPEGQARGAKTSAATCGEGAPKFSLLEEKQKAWQEEPGSGPAPESHYVEMHRIINRNSGPAH